MRGVRFSLDNYTATEPWKQDRAPEDAWVQSLPCRGINALHVYAETSEANRPAGYNETELMKMVRQTRENGLYLVITIGKQITDQFTKDFWRHYAPKLKCEPHLVFEIANEPYVLIDPQRGLFFQPYSDAARQLQADAYAIIRGDGWPDPDPNVPIGATETPVLLFSYGFLQDADAVFADVDSVVQRISQKTIRGQALSIDWTRTAVAFHGYHDDTLITLEKVLHPTAPGRTPIPVMETELTCGDPCAPVVDEPKLHYIRAYEGHGISWLSFLDIGRDLNGDGTINPLDLDRHWNDRLRNQVLWAPDKGTFPGSFSVNPPAHQTIVAGQSGSLQARVTVQPAHATPPLRYQWFQGNSGNRGTPIAGAAASTLTVNPPVTTPYWVEVKDECDNAAISQTFVVTVTDSVRRAALRSAGGQYVVAEGGGGSSVYSNRTAVGPWETFRIIDLNGGVLNSGDPINIRVDNGKYVSALGGGGGAVVADRAVAAEWERFTIQKQNGGGAIVYGDAVAFRSWSGHYLVAENGGNDIVKCDRTAAGAWETFTVVSPTSQADESRQSVRPDVVWKATDGGHVVWSMNGTVAGSTSRLPVQSDSGWEVVASGDFDGDGHMDLFWRRDSRANAIWFMTGIEVRSTAPVIEVADLDIRLVGTGDFNGDGKTDLFWRNDATGYNYIWLMNGAQVATAAYAAHAYHDWRVVGAADFNGDGKGDLAWRNQATGENAIWLMNGTAIASSALIIPVPQQEWKVVMTGDYDGDGKGDLFWRNEQTAQTAVWLLNGTAVAATEYAPGVDLAWRVVAGADYDRDGKSDLLWRNGDDTRVWLMNRNVPAIYDSTRAAGLAAVVAPLK